MSTGTTSFLSHFDMLGGVVRPSSARRDYSVRNASVGLTLDARAALRRRPD